MDTVGEVRFGRMLRTLYNARKFDRKATRRSVTNPPPPAPLRSSGKVFTYGDFTTSGFRNGTRSMRVAGNWAVTSGGIGILEPSESD